MKGPLSPNATKPIAKASRKLKNRKPELGNCNSLFVKEPNFFSILRGTSSPLPQFKSSELSPLL